MTCGLFDGRAVLIVSELEAVTVAGRAKGVSSSAARVPERSTVPGLPDVRGVRGVRTSSSWSPSLTKFGGSVEGPGGRKSSGPSSESDTKAARRATVFAW